MYSNLIPLYSLQALSLSELALSVFHTPIYTSQNLSSNWKISCESYLKCLCSLVNSDLLDKFLGRLGRLSAKESPPELFCNSLQPSGLPKMIGNTPSEALIDRQILPASHRKYGLGLEKVGGACVCVWGRWGGFWRGGTEYLSFKCSGTKLQAWQSSKQVLRIVQTLQAMREGYGKQGCWTKIQLQEVILAWFACFKVDSTVSEGSRYKTYRDFGQPVSEPVNAGCLIPINTASSIVAAAPARESVPLCSSSRFARLSAILEAADETASCKKGSKIAARPRLRVGGRGKALPE